MPLCAIVMRLVFATVEWNARLSYASLPHVTTVNALFGTLNTPALCAFARATCGRPAPIVCQLTPSLTTKRDPYVVSISRDASPSIRSGAVGRIVIGLATEARPDLSTMQ